MSLKRKIQRQNNSKEDRQITIKNEMAMIAGIMEGSPDAVGVVVVRMECGCRKMAAVDVKGEAASKVIMYRDQSESICDQCQEDDGAFVRVKEQFIHWEKELDDATREMITNKVIGSQPVH
ncbi:MAG: hypothetical protein RI601_02965 [Desulfurivibrionaceae bacterium]|nr:hypothetical protein [Desulfurivibrionaceae bacterium]